MSIISLTPHNNNNTSTTINSSLSLSLSLSLSVTVSLSLSKIQYYNHKIPSSWQTPAAAANPRLLSLLLFFFTRISSTWQQEISRLFLFFTSTHMKPVSPSLSHFLSSDKPHPWHLSAPQLLHIAIKCFLSLTTNKMSTIAHRLHQPSLVPFLLFLLRMPEDSNPILIAI